MVKRMSKPVSKCPSAFRKNAWTNRVCPSVFSKSAWTLGHHPDVSHEIPDDSRCPTNLRNRFLASGHWDIETPGFEKNKTPLFSKKSANMSRVQRVPLNLRNGLIGLLFFSLCAALFLPS